MCACVSVRERERERLDKLHGSVICDSLVIFIAFILMPLLHWNLPIDNEKFYGTSWWLIRVVPSLNFPVFKDYIGCYINYTKQELLPMD